MSSLTETQLVTLHQQLLQLQKDLITQIESGRSATETVSLDQSKVGRLSRMDAMQQQNMAQSSQRNISQRLRRVNIALAKFASGDYGYCENCGMVIAADRLAAQPEAPCCFACQSQQEYHPQS